MYKKFVICFLFVLASAFVSAQNIESWISSNEKIPVEKIYVHTDTDDYFTGDTVWFKVYLTDSRSGRLIPSAENVYVNMIDEFGESNLKLVLLCVNGHASGSFVIPESAKAGNYLLQAYTNYLFNFEPDSHFYKQLTISKISGSSRSISKSNSSGKMVAEVKFFPEGGVLLENANNVVAFRAVDRFGYGVDVSGKIKDEKGVEIATFSADYKGMGMLFLNPETGKSYFATIDGFPSFRYQFEPVKEGAKIQFVNHTSNEVIINIARNVQENHEEVFYIVNMYRGEVLFYQEFKMEGINQVLKFKSTSLKPGINKLILLDKSFITVSERLLFSENNKSNSLFVEADKKVYDKRSKIMLKIADEKYNNDEDFSNLSVSIVHQLLVPEDGFSKNVLSNILIDSELKGFVDSSADLFKDTEISSETKLRLLMLTSDRDYFWDYAPRKQEQLKFKRESGINLTGNAKNITTQKIMENGEITMAIQKDDEVAFLTNETDSLGNFSFPGLLFTDTVALHVQAKTETGKMNVEINLDPVFKNSDPAESQFGLLKDKSMQPSKLAELKYDIYNQYRKSQPKVKKTKNNNSENKYNGDDGHFRLYEKADFVLEVDPFEQSYGNVMDYMVGKVPGVDVNGDNIQIRGASSFGGNSMPLFLLDGVPLVESQNFSLPFEVQSGLDENGTENINTSNQLIQTIQSIPLSDVDKIEILKSAHNTAVYGVKGANGVIAIYTRKGEATRRSSIGKGIVENRIVGYATHKEFFSPKYAEVNLNNEQPDLRTLLYWNPEVITEKGKAELVFFSSDQPGKYMVIVEGFSNDGNICVGRTEFEVR